MQGNGEVLRRLAELERRMALLQQYGTVTEVNADAARVKVKISSVVSEWLPWQTARAGGVVSIWSPPEVGERVLVICPMGELRQAFVLPAIFTSVNQPPSSAAGEAFMKLGPTTLKVAVGSDGRVTLSATGGVDVTGDVQITGDLTVNGNVLTTGNTEINGSQQVVGPVTCLAAGSFVGPVAVGGLTAAGGGAVSASGGLTTPDDIVAGGVSLSSHTHTSADQGVPTSTPN